MTAVAQYIRNPTRAESQYEDTTSTETGRPTSQSTAVYSCPEGRYAFRGDQFPDTKLVFGNFGENLSTRRLTKHVVHIGDRFRVGSAILQATQPRMPCCKPGIRFYRPQMVKRFWRSGRRGICNSVVNEGDLAARRHHGENHGRPNGLSVADGIALQGTRRDPELLSLRVS